MHFPSHIIANTPVRVSFVTAHVYFLKPLLSAGYFYTFDSEYIVFCLNIFYCKLSSSAVLVTACILIRLQTPGRQFRQGYLREFIESQGMSVPSEV